MSRPDFVTDEHLRFLDALRLSGEINMFGAAGPLAEAFGLARDVARAVHAYWMQTFGDPDR